MIPLAGSNIPASAAELVDALRGGLTSRGLPPRDITADGPWPALATFVLDLTGCQLTRSQRWPRPGEFRDGAFTAETFRLLAEPVTFESAPVRVALRAEGATFEFTGGGDQERSLVLQRATRGNVVVEVACADLERVTQDLAVAAARQHGVDVKGTNLALTSRGPRSASVSAEITAKMFVATVTVTVSGDIDLDDTFTARLSNLRFAGSGMAGNLAGGVIRPLLAKLEGASWPLLSFAAGGMQLRDVRLEIGDSLRLSAEFGA